MPLAVRHALKMNNQKTISTQMPAWKVIEPSVQENIILNPIIAQNHSTKTEVVHTAWREEVDDTSGRAYYVNSVTGESQWEKPTDSHSYKSEEVLSVNQIDAGLSSMWKTIIDQESGKNYYVNLETGETQWAKPPTSCVRGKVGSHVIGIHSITRSHDNDDSDGSYNDDNSDSSDDSNDSDDCDSTDNTKYRINGLQVNVNPLHRSEQIKHSKSLETRKFDKNKMFHVCVYSGCDSLAKYGSRSSTYATCCESHKRENDVLKSKMHAISKW